MKYSIINYNLFDVPSDFYLVRCISADFHTTKGIAGLFNERFNTNEKLEKKYPQYVLRYIAEKMDGDCLLMDNVLNLVVKEGCFDQHQKSSFKNALNKMKRMCAELGIKNIAMCPLTSMSNGDLPWESVSEYIKNLFHDTDINIFICSGDVSITNINTNGKTSDNPNMELYGKLRNMTNKQLCEFFFECPKKSREKYVASCEMSFRFEKYVKKGIIPADGTIPESEYPFSVKENKAQNAS